jgi:hypothetical protein
MLVKINRGPNFGQEVHVPVSQETNLAILLGDIVPVEQEQPKKPAPDVPTFYVGRHKINDKVMLFFRQGINEEMWYDGPAEYAHRGFGKRTVPPALINEYKLALEQESKANAIRIMATMGDRSGRM